MAFQFNPDEQQQIPEMTPPPERVGRFSIAIIGAFVTLILVWFAWTPVAFVVKAALGRRCAREAHVALETKNWGRAAEQTIAAFEGFDYVVGPSGSCLGMLRHYPELEPVIGDVERVFAPWPKLGAPVPGKKNPVVQLADSVRAYLPWG